MEKEIDAVKKAAEDEIRNFKKSAKTKAGDFIDRKSGRIQDFCLDYSRYLKAFFVIGWLIIVIGLYINKIEFSWIGFVILSVSGICCYHGRSLIIAILKIEVKQLNELLKKGDREHGESKS